MRRWSGSRSSSDWPEWHKVCGPWFPGPHSPFTALGRAAGAVLVLLYTLLGFYVVPRLVRSGVHDFVSKNYHREVAIGDVRFNPYTLRLDVRDFSLPDADGQADVGFSASAGGPDRREHLAPGAGFRVDPAGAAVRAGADQARRDAEFERAGAAAVPGRQARSRPAKPARLFIKHFKRRRRAMSRSRISRIPSAFRTEIKPITFDLRDFTTVGKEGGALFVERERRKQGSDLAGPGR